MKRSRRVKTRAWMFGVLAVLVSFGVLTATAQKKSIKQYVHDIWTTANGLPQNSAASILQTRDGYIWFATQEGLARFDGMEFRVFDRTNTKELPASWFIRLKEDSAGGLWMRPIGFAPGMARYRDGVFSFFDTSNGLPHNRAITWEVDRHGTMWIGTPGGLFESRDGKFRTYTVRDGLPSDTVFGLGLDRKENLWISTTRGLARLSGGTIEKLTGRPEYPDTVFLRLNGPSNICETRSGTIWMTTRTHLLSYAGGVVTRYDKKAVLSDPTINAVHEDAQGTLWFATPAGLNSFKGGRFTAHKVSSDADENFVFIIREDREGSLWLATGKGIARYSGGSFERYDRKDGLSDNTVQDILIDREGSIWVSTNGGGVDRFRDEKFITYSSKVGLSYDMVQTVIEDRAGALWVGTSFGGLNRIKDGVITVIDDKKGLPLLGTRALGEDKDGTIWIASARGLHTLRDGVITLRSRLVNGEPDILPGAFLLTKAGEWLVASRDTLFSYRNGKYTMVTTVGTPRNRADFIGILFEDRTGAIWISTETQHVQVQERDRGAIGPDQGFTGVNGNAFYEDPEGVLWIAPSDNGIIRYKDGKFVSISPRQGLFDFLAYTVFEDQAGYLWMSCNKGVYRVSKKELNDVADGKAQSVTCTSYGTADGMESRECNGGYSPSGYQLKDGRLSFVTTRGLAVVNPADIRINTVPPPVVIDRFLVEGERQSSTSIRPGSSRQIPL